MSQNQPQNPFAQGQTPPVSGQPSPHYGQPQYGQPPVDQQQYVPPQYAAQPYGQAPYAVAPPMDGVSIAAFVTSLVGFSVVGLVLGIIGLNRTQNGERSGRGFAIAGIVIGGLGLIATIAVVVMVFSGVLAYSAW